MIYFAFWAAVIASALILIVMGLVWLERKVSAHMQQRFGPMVVGRHGYLQLIADAIKLVLKEDITPTDADKIVFFLAPVLIFTGAFMAYLVIPLGNNIIVRDLNIGIIYIIAVTSLTVLSIMMAGISSGSKWSLLGAFRGAAQIISYEVPLVLSLLGPIMIAGSLSTVAIVNSQSRIWFILVQPVAFIIYIICATAEVNRTPFDIPEAESELVAGYFTEYSGMKFGMFYFAEYINMFTAACIAVIVFLGGWSGAFLPGPIWFLIKTFFVIFIFMWLRWTLPRFRVDQLMEMGWKYLIPVAFLNLAVTALIFGIL